MQMSETVAMVVVLPTLFGTIAYVLKSAIDGLRRSRQARMQVDLYSKMLDKFGGSQDFLAWLQSDAGKSFLETVPLDKTRPHGRIMTTVQAGIVLTALALAMLLLRMGLGSEAQEPLLVMGSLGLALGVGLLASAAATIGFSKKWGLINGRTEER
jgi:hypothetical protein